MRCSENVARILAHSLLGDAEFPIGGIPAYTYFTSLSYEDATSEYWQLWELPDHDRPRDFMERMGLDGRVAS